MATSGGQPGNKNSAKPKRWQEALNKALARYTNAEQKIEMGQALDRIAEKVVTAAITGDWDAIQEIGNRLDGKPAQTIAGDPEAPLFISHVERTIVRPKAPASDS